MKKHLLYLCYGVIMASTASAQIVGERLYLPHANPPSVKAENNRELAFPWSGGANNPQLAMADLNHDGIKDLVIFDPYGGVRTYLNTSSTPGNPKYVHHPEYQGIFPIDLNGYLKLEDYNRDKIPDLVYRGYSGVTIMKGSYDSKNVLKFTLQNFAGKNGLYYLTGGSGMVNVYVAPNDMPAMADVDGDGDLDILSYDVSGTSIYYYRNCQMEEYPTQPDSFPICVKDNCWGKSVQQYARQLLLHINCGNYGTTCKGCDDPTAGGKTTHSGNTLTAVDMDNDGDIDMFNGNVSFSDIQYTTNIKKDINYPIDSMMTEDTLWGSNGKSAYIPQMPAAFWLDLDNDGDKDLAFTPFLTGTENYKSIVYFRNMGTDGHPNMVYQSDTLFMQDMIDVGTAAAPVLYDYNKDGLVDMFVGGEGLYQASNGAMKTVVFYYENTGTLSAPAFTLRSRDFMNLSAAGIDGASIAIGDLDGDNKDDMVIGKKDGTIVYYRNNAATQLMQPVWQSPFTLNDQYGMMDVGDNASPFIYDLNKDGKKDLIVGSKYGRLFYYRNLGGGTAPNYNPYYSRITDTLGGVNVIEYNSFYTYLSPYIGKIDNSPKDYLIVGSKLGILYRYDISNLNKFTLIDSAYSQVNVRDQAKPYIADIDNDGHYEMVVGNEVGGVTIYKQYFSTDVKDVHAASNGGITVYPNPAKSVLNVDWQTSFGTGNVHISLISVTGQKLYDADVDGGSLNTVKIDISNIPNGTYYCIVRSSENQASSPVSIVR